MIGNYGKKTHPLGNRTLTESMVKMITPLLLHQKQFAICKAYTENTPVDYDLDLFRKYPFPKSSGNISRWYFYVFAINADLGKKWLSAAPDTNYGNSIIIARSMRYNAPGISYAFLNAYENLFFVGVKEEFELMKKQVAKLVFLPVDDFLQMAAIIAGCKLFIGNQSFPFALAEALKVKRLLEVYHLCPNVVPEGINGYDFCYQAQFEFLVKKLLDN
jgi:hypothetical protein